MLRIDSKIRIRMIRMLLPRALLCAVLSLVCALSLALDADQDAPDSKQFVQEMIVRAHQKLTTGLYKTYARKPGNLIISPWSVMTLLTVTYMVAGGRTANEIGDHLNINLLRRKEVLEGFKHINDIFQTDAANSDNNNGSSGSSPSSEVLKSLNGALLGKRVRPNRRLQKQLKDSLSTYMHKVFSRGGPGHRPEVMPPWGNDSLLLEEAGDGGGGGGGGDEDEDGDEVRPSGSPPPPPAGEENGSGQQLQGLLPGEEGLESKMSFWLFNWMLFQGQWRSPFSPGETHGAEFWAQGRESVTVATMTVKARFPRTHDPGLNMTLLELPYGQDSPSSGDVSQQGQASGRFGMFILLPDARAGLGRLEKKLKHFTLEALLTQPLWDRSAKVFLPKFKFRTDIMLNEAMKKMGYKRMFDPNEADFARLVPKRRKGRRSPYVQTMVHRAAIDVDEKGTVASASSALRLSFRKYVPIVRVDHPFMFVLRDKTLGINLFIGRVTDPRELS